MDVLSHFLDVTGLRGQVFCQTVATAPWGLWIPARPRIGLHLVDRGTCWLRIGEQGEPVRLVPGDVALVPHGEGHALYDDPTSELMSFETWKVSKDAESRLIRRHDGGGAETVVICGGYESITDSLHPLVKLLPARVFVPAAEAPRGLERALRSLRTEIDRPDIGSRTLISRLLDVVFVEILRYWLEKMDDPSWLGALRDRGLATALGRLHEDPARRWTVAELALQVGMSRAVLARRFRDGVGESPLAYLAQVRMDAAARLLIGSDDSLSAVARQVGYDSEHAFNRAFKRARGVPPGAYRRSRRDV
ncbi:MAG: AraC family transcriptional regulator [Acidobacteriota bacterium]